MQRNTNKKIAPIIVTIIVVLCIAPVICLIAYLAGIAVFEGFGAVLPFLLLYALIGGAVLVGIILAMRQRLREINGGEEDEASKY